MKVTVTEAIKDLEGTPLKFEGADATLRVVFYTALNTFGPDERPTAETKAKCFGVMQKLFASKEVALTSDEAALIKERVAASFWSPLIYGRVCEVLDGTTAA